MPLEGWTLVGKPWMKSRPNVWATECVGLGVLAEVGELTTSADSINPGSFNRIIRAYLRQWS